MWAWMLFTLLLSTSASGSTAEMDPSDCWDGDACFPGADCNGVACDDGNAGTTNDACDGSGTCAGTSPSSASASAETSSESTASLRVRKTAEFYPSCVDLVRNVATGSEVTAANPDGTADKGAFFCANFHTTLTGTALTVGSTNELNTPYGIGDVKPAGVAYGSCEPGMSTGCPTAQQYRAKAPLPTALCWPDPKHINSAGTATHQCPVKEVSGSDQHCCELCQTVATSGVASVCTVNSNCAGALCSDNDDTTFDDQCTGASTACAGTPCQATGGATCVNNAACNGGAVLASQQGVKCSDTKDGTFNDRCNPEAAVANGGVCKGDDCTSGDTNPLTATPTATVLTIANGAGGRNCATDAAIVGAGGVSGGCNNVACVDASPSQGWVAATTLAFDALVSGVGTATYDDKCTAGVCAGTKCYSGTPGSMSCANDARCGLQVACDDGDPATVNEVCHGNGACNPDGVLDPVRNVAPLLVGVRCSAGSGPSSCGGAAASTATAAACTAANTAALALVPKKPTCDDTYPFTFQDMCKALASDSGCEGTACTTGAPGATAVTSGVRNPDGKGKSFCDTDSACKDAPCFTTPGFYGAVCGYAVGTPEPSTCPAGASFNNVACATANAALAGASPPTYGCGLRTECTGSGSGSACRISSTLTHSGADITYATVVTYGTGCTTGDNTVAKFSVAGAEDRFYYPNPADGTGGTTCVVDSACGPITDSSSGTPVTTPGVKCHDDETGSGGKTTFGSTCDGTSAVCPRGTECQPTAGPTCNADAECNARKCDDGNAFTFDDKCSGTTCAGTPCTSGSIYEVEFGADIIAGTAAVNPTNAPTAARPEGGSVCAVPSNGGTPTLTISVGTSCDGAKCSDAASVAEAAKTFGNTCSNGQCTAASGTKCQPNSGTEWCNADPKCANVACDDGDTLMTVPTVTVNDKCASAAVGLPSGASSRTCAGTSCAQGVTPGVNSGGGATSCTVTTSPPGGCLNKECQDGASTVLSYCNANTNACVPGFAGINTATSAYDTTKPFYTGTPGATSCYGGPRPFDWGSTTQSASTPDAVTGIETVTLGGTPATLTYTNACDDGDASTFGDRCTTALAGRSSSDGISTTACEGKPCQPTAGSSTCGHATCQGQTCVDGDSATLDDTCKADLSCSGNPCYTGTPGTTSCSNDARCAGKACDDGRVATGGDKCSATGGCAGTFIPSAGIQIAYAPPPSAPGAPPVAPTPAGAGAGAGGAGAGGATLAPTPAGGAGGATLAPTPAGGAGGPGGGAGGAGAGAGGAGGATSTAAPTINLNQVTDEETTYPVIPSLDTFSTVNVEAGTSFSEAQFNGFTAEKQNTIKEDGLAKFVEIACAPVGCRADDVAIIEVSWQPRQERRQRHRRELVMVFTFIFKNEIDQQIAIDSAAAFEAAIKGGSVGSVSSGAGATVSFSGIQEVITPAVVVDCLICGKSSKVKFTALTIQYNAAGANQNNQAGKAYGALAGTFPATANLQTTKGPAFAAVVSDGDQFTISTTDKFSAWLELQLDGGAHGHVGIHASCSVDIALGDKFGPFEIISASTKPSDSRCKAGSNHAYSQSQSHSHTDNACTPSAPCAAGGGDCDANDDCIGALVCVASTDGMLSGGGKSDYCGDACTPSTPCAAGGGDCDANDDCIGALVCVASSDGMLSGGGKSDYCGVAVSALKMAAVTHKVSPATTTLVGMLVLAAGVVGTAIIRQRLRARTANMSPSTPDREPAPLLANTQTKRYHGVSYGAANN